MSNPNIATLAANIKQGVESRLKDLHTAMPGIIESFDTEKQTVSVQPAIRRIFKTTESETEFLTPTDIPILINVPIHYPRGGGFSMTFPIKKGDECLLVFCERSIDNWHKNSGIVTPTDKRFHSLSDAIAFVGVSSLKNSVPNYSAENIEIKKDDGDAIVRIKPDGAIELESSTGVKVIGDFEVTGATTLSGTVTSNGKDISDTHTHVGSPTAPSGPVSNTGAPI